MSLAQSARLLAATDHAPQEVEVAPISAETRRYWSDPVFAAEMDAEAAANRARCNAAFDAAMRRKHPHFQEMGE